MDVLSDVMRVVRLNGADFSDVRASEPVRAQTPNMVQLILAEPARDRTLEDLAREVRHVARHLRRSFRRMHGRDTGSLSHQVAHAAGVEFADAARNADRERRLKRSVTGPKRRSIARSRALSESRPAHGAVLMRSNPEMPFSPVCLPSKQEICPLDVLSDVMRAVRLNGAVFFDMRAGEPFICETPNMALVGKRLDSGVRACHSIPHHDAGSMLGGTHRRRRTGVGIQGRRRRLLPARTRTRHYQPKWRPGGFAPRSVRHGRPLPIMMNIAEHGPPSLRMVCGYLSCDIAPYNPLLEALPSQVLARRPIEGNHTEVDLIYSAVAESETHRAGGEAILARLSELLFVRVLRRYIETLPEHSDGWLAGLRDPHIGRALQTIRRRSGTRLDIGRSGAGNRNVPRDPRRALRQMRRRDPDALPCQMAHATGGASADPTRNSG